MVIIAHLADTHLGFQIHEGRINYWKEKNKITWYEDHIYQAWESLLNIIIDHKDEIACVVHAGDLYHTPYKGYAFPPSENARALLMRTLKNFFEQTEEKIPFIVIDGNHGVYSEYYYSPIDSIKEVFPNFHFFSKDDLKDALRENKRLIFKMEDDKIAIHLFPYFEYTDLKEYETLYHNWVTSVQTPIPGYLNIAVAHGMKSDNTLHSKILEHKYDYIALGHDHTKQQVNKRAFYAGSIYPLDFGDYDLDRGMIFAEIESNTVPKVTYHTQESSCHLVEVPIEVTLQQTVSDVLTEVTNRLEQFQEPWDGNSASRVKIQFKGSIMLETYWKIRDELEILRREINNKLTYNILQLLWYWEEARTELGTEIAPGTIIEYILEDPQQEFKDFIEAKVDPNEVDLDLLSELAAESIESALKEEQ